MKDMMTNILGTDKLNVGDRVKVIGNSCGHGYLIGGIGTINNQNPNPYGTGVKGYLLNIDGMNGGTWITLTDIESADKKDIVDKQDLLKELSLVIELLNEIPDDEFKSMEKKKLIKKFKTFKFLKLFNGAKNEYEKLKVLEDIID